MSADIVSALRNEENQLLAELRASLTFRRLEAVRRLVALYGAEPGAREETSADSLLNRPEPEPVRPMAKPVPDQPSASPAPAPKAEREPAPIVAPVAFQAPIPAPDLPATPRNLAEPPETSRESSKAVSAVRAALLAVTR